MANSTETSTKTAITPRRDQDFPEWYQQAIRAAELAEPSDVRGCMVIRPWGYGIWENMQRQLDAMFRATGHRNAYFPLFIPLSYFAKEAEHVEGFAKECAVVTHTRLEVDADGKMKPASPLTEPLVIRPTSETIIGASYARWVQSYRDLPILINQWANVVRWEMRPRLFLRTTEFLWQEGHTVHETEAEARAETKLILDLYERFVRDHLAIPVFIGEKSESERFPGAVQTLSIEAMVQDRKAIEADVDQRDLGGGTKNWEWIKKGVPLRVEIGPRDLEKNSVEVSRRDQAVKAKESMSMREFVRRAPEILDSIQQNLYEHARKFRDENTRMLDSKKEFYDFFTPKNSEKPEIHGGFGLAHWNGSREVEDQIKNDLKVTIRCIPPAAAGEPGRCIFTGEPSPRRVIWAKAY